MRKILLPIVKFFGEVTLPAGASSPINEEIAKKASHGKLLDEMERIISAKEGTTETGFKVRSGDYFSIERLEGSWPAESLLVSIHRDYWFVVAEKTRWREAAIDGEFKFWAKEREDGLLNKYGEVKVRIRVLRRGKQ